MAFNQIIEGQIGLPILLAGENVCLLPEGALWWPRRQWVIFADLHFEKGSFFAARGQPIPPYDTDRTLDHIEGILDKTQPKACVSLGDSFHDPEAETRLTQANIARLQNMTRQTQWLWITGNHDPHPPVNLGGEAHQEIQAGPFIFRHEPSGAWGEIAGHLHPVAKVRANGRSVRRKCFIGDAGRLILPALGAYTGGLNIRHAAFAALFSDAPKVYALSANQIYLLSNRRLVPDV